MSDTPRNQSRLNDYRERWAKEDAQRKAAAENSPEARTGKALEDISTNTKSLEELFRIAEALVAQVKLTELEAEAARKDARDSKILSIISVAIALATLFLQLRR